MDESRPEASPRRTPPRRAPLPAWWWEQTLQTRQLIAGGLVVLVVLGAVAFFTAGGGDVSGDDEPAGPTEAELFVAALTPERIEIWESLAQCESETQWALDTGNGYYGGLQISDVTWRGVGGGGLPHLTPREEQIMRAEAIYEVQGWGAWPRCSAQLGLPQ